MADSTTPESQTPATSQTPQPILKPHTNTVVPHAIADYDTDLVQLNVWTGAKWINVFDGNDFKNMNIDLNRVAKVVEDQVVEIEKAVKQANDAMDQANQAVDASNVNKTAISDVETAANEAKQNIADTLKKVTDLGTQVNKNQTDIAQTKDSISLKADQTTVDDINKQVTQNEATLSTLSDEIKLKVDSTTVNEIVDGKDYTTAETAQALIDQTADKISSTITNLKTTVDNNGKAISTTNDQVSNLTQTIDGLQVTIKNKADQSQIAQLSNQITEKVSTKDYQTEIGLLQHDLNLRISKGDVISQLNLEAGGDGLIQVANGKGKLLLDADSVIFGENSKAFIPSAYITDINADKITTGILKSIAINNGDGAFTVNPAGDVVANSITVRNGNIFQGQIIGASFYTIDRTTDTEKKVTKFTSLNQVDDSIDDWFKINGRIMEWHHGDEYASIGPSMLYIQGTGSNTKEMWTDGLTLVGTNGVTISAGSKAYPGKVSSDYYIHQKQNIAWASLTKISVTNDEIKVSLAPDGDSANDNKGAQFSIWKDQKVGAYFGKGNNGNEIEFVLAGNGAAFNVSGPLNVNGLRVTGAKNSVVKTSQGYVGINAYETAEYYFGDIGEADTGENGQVVIGIDKIFSETINTKVPYQVFITPYSDCHVWVDQRFGNRFVVKSDKPNAQFGWELKAKRKGYENYRLRHVDGIKEKGEFKV